MLNLNTDIFGIYSNVNDKRFQCVIEEYLSNYDQTQFRNLYVKVSPQIGFDFETSNIGIESAMRNLLEKDQTISSDTVELLLKFGIQVDNRVSIVERLSLLVIESEQVFETEQTLSDYISEFKGMYLPIDQQLTHYILKFPVESRIELDTYNKMLLECTGEHLTSLITYVLPTIEDTLETEMLGRQTVRYTYEDAEALLGDIFTTANIEVEIRALQSRMDTFYNETLKDKAIVTETHNKIDTLLTSFYKLSLAYFDATFNAVIISRGKIHVDYLANLKDFYVQFRFYTMFDKIMFLRNYPKLSHSSRGLCDYLMYSEDKDRQLNCTVKYIDDNNQLCETEVDLLVTDIEVLEDTEMCNRDLVWLENALRGSFLNIKNCVYVCVDGVRRFCYIPELTPQFSVYVIPTHGGYGAYQRDCNLNELLSIHPLNQLECLFNDKGETILHSLSKVTTEWAMELKSELSDIEALKRKNSVYCPSYAKSNIGVLFYKITALIANKKVIRFVDKTESDDLRLYFILNVVACDNCIDQLHEILSIQKLRHNGNIARTSELLDMYGLTRAIPLSADLLRNVYLD